jgi:hypothetical protein
MVAIAVLKAKKVLKETFGTDIFDGLGDKWTMVKIGAGIVIALAVALVVLAAALTIVGVLLAVVAVAALLMVAAILIIPAILLLLGVAAVAAGVMLINGFQKAWAYLSGLDFGSIASSMIQGLVNGIASGAGAVMGAIQNLASGMKSTLESALKIGSPSRVFAQMGEFTSQGFAQGVEAGTGDVESAVSGMVSTSTGAATEGAPATAGAGGGIQIGAIYITGVKDAEQLKSPSFMEQLAEQLRAAIQSGGNSPQPEGAA